MTRLTFEVTDESKVPREYLIVDDRKIRQAIKENKKVKIDGVRIYEKETLTNKQYEYIPQNQRRIQKR
jgi:ribosomal protein S2